MRVDNSLTCLLIQLNIQLFSIFYSVFLKEFSEIGLSQLPFEFQFSNEVGEELIPISRLHEVEVFNIEWLRAHDYMLRIYPSL